jgi:hypothetical protein
MAEGEEITAADLPSPVREYATTGAGPLPAGARGSGEAPPAGDRARGPSTVIDVDALRRAIRSSDPVAAGRAQTPHEIPAHFAYAKRTYLETLIDEFGGDLSLIARYWDRSSPKTIRKLVRDCGLEERLKAARERAQRPEQGRES